MATIEEVAFKGDIIEMKTATPLPTTVEEADALQLEKLSLEKDLLQAQMQLLDMQRQQLSERMQAQFERGNAVGKAMREKYRVGAADRVDVAARKIERA